MQKKWAIDLLKSSSVIENADVGNVVLDEKRIKQAFRYLKSDEEIAAFSTVPAVIKDGIKIYDKTNHKGRDYPTISFAGRVKINNQEALVGVSLKLTTDNFYKMHRILMPDGTVFEFDENEKSKVERSVPTSTNDADNTTAYFASNTNVPQNSDGVNNNSMQKTEKHSYKEPVDSEGRTLSEGQIDFFKNVASELRDENGKIKPFYHGTSRADRVGYYFDPDRATSGPMAFFTDSKDIAGNYSRDKADTSLAYDSEYDTYETQFRVNVNGNSIPIVDYWYRLSQREKLELTEKIKQVTLDDDYEKVILKPDNKYGIGNFNDYEMRYARGNALQVLVDGWLGGGTLLGEEEKFLDVLSKIGIKNVEYKNPNYREEKVYKCYLNITNPFNTENLDQEFIDDLTDFVDSTDLSIYETETANADLWDKHNIDVYDWIDKLQDDLDNDTTHAWTSIPDIVTDFLKDYGKYDGIIDKGGKGGGVGHTVAIPFFSNQIKATDNLNPTKNVDIRYSKQESFDNALTSEEWKKYNNAIATGNDKGLRINDNSILVECENNSRYNYKYVCYEEICGEKIITDVYGIGRIDNNYADNVSYVPKDIAKYINDVKEQGYDNRQYVSQILRSFIKNTSYVLSRYNNKSSRYNVIGRGSVEYGVYTRDRAVGNRISGSIGNNVNYSLKEPINNTSLLDDNDELADINENVTRMLEIVSGSGEFAKLFGDVTTIRSSDDNVVSEIAKSLRKKYDSSYNKGTLVSRLIGLYEYIANAGTDIDNDYIFNTAKEIATDLLAHTQYKNTDVYDTYKEWRDYIRTTTVKVSFL